MKHEIGNRVVKAGEVLDGSHTVDGKLICGLCATTGNEGHWVAIVSKNVEAIRDVWIVLQQTLSPDLPDLDESMIQKVVIGEREKVTKNHENRDRS